MQDQRMQSIPVPPRSKMRQERQQAANGSLLPSLQQQTHRQPPQQQRQPQAQQQGRNMMRKRKRGNGGVPRTRDQTRATGHTPTYRLEPQRTVDNTTTTTTTTTTTKPRVPRVLVIYFPQYHPDPLNDQNWGINFTDWMSLQKSPTHNRLGHAIPRPTELGYYDLRQTTVRNAQGSLARQYGIHGFVYHHYWFYDPTHAGPNLAAPLLAMLDDGHPNVPFFLNWCATKWVNVWMGKPLFQTIPTNKNRAIVLQEQYFNASHEQIQEHYQWLSQFFHHPNYILMDNQPILLLYYYDIRALPILQRLRYLAQRDGFDGLYLLVGRSAAPDHLFQPGNLTDRLKQVMDFKTQTLNMIEMDTFNQSLLYPYPLEWVTQAYEIPDWCTNHPRMAWTPEQAGDRHEILGLLTAFDNTPRREFDHSVIYTAGTPEHVLQRFEQNVRAVLYYTMCCRQPAAPDNNDAPTTKPSLTNGDDQLVVINAWNE